MSILEAPRSSNDSNGNGYGGDGNDGIEGDTAEVLPWWRNPVNVVVIAIAVAVLAGAAGLVIGNNRALADPNATDVGFLQDMRVHHEQAVQMGLLFLDRPDTEPALQTIAREVVVGQNIEIGRMIQMLRGFGESEVNESDTAMAWMGHPVESAKMPGMATQDQLISLATASGGNADEIFVTLMSAHHQGGVHMAEQAADAAGVDDVRLMARQIAEGQRHEIDEMNTLLARSAA